jgi:hypothetical protein
MRAIKLITVSTVAVLMGGASLAIGQEGAGTLQGGSSILEETPLNPGVARGSETEDSNPRAAETPVRRSETSGERSSSVHRSRGLQRGQAIAAERGRAISRERSQAIAAERGRAISRERGQAVAAERGRAIPRERGQAMTAGRTIGGEHRLARTVERGRAIGGERGLAMTAERRLAATGQGMKAAQIKSQLGSQPRQAFGQAETGPAYGRASSDRNAGAGLNAEQRARLREILAARRDIPRVSNLSDVRINAVIPRSVRLAAIPEEVVRIYPRFRRHQAFIYRNEMVVVDPLTSRVVAVLPA